MIKRVRFAALAIMWIILFPLLVGAFDREAGTQAVQAPLVQGPATTGQEIDPVSAGSGTSHENAVSRDATVQQNLTAPFDWYRYQGEENSGAAWGNAYCGQTSVAMAIQYAHDNQWVRISEIVDSIGKGVYEYTSPGDLSGALARWGVDHKMIAVDDMNGIESAINERHHIVVVPLTMSLLSQGVDCGKANTDPALHYHRYHPYGSGHWLVAKGISNDGNWVIVHDPNVFNGGIYWYSGNVPKGKERYYSYSEFQQGFQHINAQAIEILRVPGDVILYWNENYDYENSENDLGYRQRTEPGWQNLDGLFNNEASSLRVSPGRSILLYEDSNRTGASACANIDVADFGTVGNFPGTLTPIDEQISSIEVFGNKYCLGPNTGMVAGVVKLKDCGAPVANALVLSLTGGGLGLRLTDSRGQYVLGGIPPGTAYLWAISPSLRDTGLTIVDVKPNKLTAGYIELLLNTCVSVPGQTSTLSNPESGDIEQTVCEPPPPPPTCPSTGGVILFKHANFDCGGGDYGAGYVRLDNPGVYNHVGSSFSDQASSIRVPAGWSVKLYQHENEGGGSACRSGDDADFWGDHFNNGVPLNDNVTSFRVYDVPDCGHNTAPSTPRLSSPANGFVADDGEAPALCWNHATDPEGNEIEYYAEVYNSPVSANSSWIRGTCWRPAALDGAYHTYNWHVKARDVPRQAQSGWSGTRTFTIEPPNQPPSISFTTANGAAIPASRRINANERDWTFQGTAGDPDGQITQITFRCSGDDCGDSSGQSGLNNWSYERLGMKGRNDVHFRAYDDDGAVTPSQHLDLRIDLKPPATTLALNGDRKATNWPTWFTAPVQVRLQSSDKATGGARAGVKEIHYRLDGGAWQTRTGADTTFTVSSDGLHTVEYYATDKVSNQEATHQATFQIDATPPSAPGAVTETHGALSGEWQRDWNDPAFTWVPATDATSQVRYYKVDWNDTLQVVADPAYDPPAVRTGSYQLGARAVDWAGNVGPEGAYFTFKYDGTPPRSPAVHNNDEIASGVWQKEVRTADFSWPVPMDEGSGIAGYNVYWGPDPAAMSDTLRVEPGFVYSTPICAENEAAIHYLRARSQDNVGWQSPWVDYALAYDGAPPTATVVANYGLTVTHHTEIHLGIVSEDEGSGVVQMRLSNDGSHWIDWTNIVTETLWQIPALGRRTHTVYLQVADGAGNLSSVVSDTIYLDVNPTRPQSDNYWLWNNQVTSGGGGITSTNYRAHATIGQSTDAITTTSPNFLLYTGFEAGAQAAPVVQPTHITYTQTGSVMASGGTGATALRSSGHKMWGTLGQPAHVRSITSTSYVMLSGFWGGTAYDLEPPPPPPPPPPEPEPEYEFYSIAINDDAPFTNSPEVTLTLCGPDPVEVMLSNTGEFSATVWQPYTRTISWTLELSGTSVQPRFVHAQFKDSSGAVYGDFVDDIVYDTNVWGGEAVFDLTELLTGTQRVEGATIEVEGEKGPVSLHVINEDTVDLYLSANDDSSGLASIQVSEYPDFTGTEWAPYAAIVPLTLDGEDGIKTVHVRFRDNAGNVSEPADASIMVDTMSPLGGLALGDQIVGPDFLTVTAYFGAIDDLSGVADMRVGQDPTLTDAVWQPYTWTLDLPISLTTETEGVLYAQYRDVSGNVSETTSDTFLVDTTAPLVHVEVAPGDTLTRAITVLAYDELVDVATMHLSNDPLMIEGVVTLAYTEVVTWTLDEREVVWVQVEDGVGNISEPYPAYAGAQLLSSELSLAPGWNLISWPLAPASTDLTDTLSLLGGACDAAWTYDAWDDANPWKEWPGDLQEVDETAGLWLHVTEPATLTLSGWQPTSAGIELRQGWNLVGYPSSTAYPVEEALASIAGQFTRIRTFEPTDVADPWKEYDVDAPVYANDLAMIEPEHGYWIYVTNDCTWLMPE